MDIYVGNLDHGVDEEGLRALFAEYGEVKSVRIITDKFSGSSRGFGFVEMPDSESANKAIEGLHESDFHGRALKVNEARGKDERGGRGGYGGGGGGRGGGSRSHGNRRGGGGAGRGGNRRGGRGGGRGGNY